MSTIVSVGQVLFSKYTPRIALLLWDHCLTFDEEVTTMWGSFKGPILPKVIYVMNRYFTEVVLLYTAYVFAGLRGPTANKNQDCEIVFWLIPMSATLIAGILQCSSPVSISGISMADSNCSFDHAARLSTLGSQANYTMVLTLLETQVVLPPRVAICAVLEVPKTMPFLMGILLLFNLFVISVSFYNALEEPRRRESEVLDSLRRDGAKIYFIVSLLWVLLLITSLFAKMWVYFPIMILAWSVAANLTSRMHLRIESLRLSNVAHPTMIYATLD
ncbi:uncharacterized protein ARMOST_22082 [Armillaria ostoyae]|uniref:DUF6533 domain-containing protein n=1 Tax=Armillaria ostoyae TaxID=47428 RepID=A0A284SBV7_ARMOS|nr:uncharacterized protein ARMOST_22082 [Armillaria ostoyae]